jgi:AhpD family alkylhydroperoxidase
VSAINGCEKCIRAHEKAVIDGGLTPDHVNDAVRIAATMQAAAVALEMEAPVLQRARRGVKRLDEASGGEPSQLRWPPCMASAGVPSGALARSAG